MPVQICPENFDSLILIGVSLGQPISHGQGQRPVRHESEVINIDLSLLQSNNFLSGIKLQDSFGQSEGVVPQGVILTDP